MKKIVLMLGVAVALAAGLSSTVEATSVYYIWHWKEGKNYYTYVKTDYKGCLNHMTNHPSDYFTEFNTISCLSN